MMNRIDLAFKNGQIERRPLFKLIQFAEIQIQKKIIEILKSISEHVDIAELGYPFNAPRRTVLTYKTVPTGQLKMDLNMKQTFELVKNYKRYKNSKPLILMGYYQIIFFTTEKKICKKMQTSWCDGLIVVDLPWPDNKNFAKLL